ncbi:polyserase-2 isoform X2 [Drosophila eugracilis]|uniref:polyserase-2 isoform X2 n=1 Tax=Drosophila eugracilis TaxID=29029 RepID=UPI0007E8451C|nr:polyserase-2 isoform X2 [Drosophila eugracilis]
MRNPYLTLSTLVSASFERVAFCALVSSVVDFVSRFVLTAAHCLVHKDKLFVHLGALDLTKPADTKAVATKYIHHLYKGYDGNDIGLLKLTSSVNYDVNIHPICIVLDKRFRGYVDSMKTFKAFGWGSTEKVLQSRFLQKIRLNHLPLYDCDLETQPNGSSKQLCAGSLAGDTCDGDSGGPLTNSVNFTVIGHREVQFGIVSYGRVSCDGPAVYTDVTSYVDWIQNTIKEYDTVDVDSSMIPHVPFKSVKAQDKWLYTDCGGDTIASYLQAKIYGINFLGQGVLITDRFVITNARGLPANYISLEVSVLGMQNEYESYRVQSAFKHPQYSSVFNDIALIKLDRSVTGPDGMKPICMLANVMDRQNAESSPYVTLLHFVESNDSFKVFEYSAALVDRNDCSYRAHVHIESNQLCIESPRGMNQIYGNPGDILGSRVMDSGKERLAVFGLVSYSWNGLIVLTNVMRHTDWIATIVKNN